MPGIQVTATDLEHPTDSSTREILDDYCIVTAGRCEVENVTIYAKADGTATHVLTVKGVRR